MTSTRYAHHVLAVLLVGSLSCSRGAAPERAAGKSEGRQPDLAFMYKTHIDYLSKHADSISKWSDDLLKMMALEGPEGRAALAPLVPVLATLEALASSLVQMEQMQACISLTADREKAGMVVLGRYTEIGRELDSLLLEVRKAKRTLGDAPFWKEFLPLFESDIDLQQRMYEQSVSMTHRLMSM